MVDFSDFKEKARRFFLGRTGVYNISPNMKCSVVNKIKRSVIVNPVRSEKLVLESHLIRWSREPAKGQRLNLFIKSPEARGGLVSHFNVDVIRTCPLLSRSISVKQNTDFIFKIPQTRNNRVSTLPEKFKKKGIIAFFYPLISDCIVKSVLEKESGTLHVWYNQSCSKKRGQMLCLVSDVGKRPPLSWKWF